MFTSLSKPISWISGTEVSGARTGRERVRAGGGKRARETHEVQKRRKKQERPIFNSTYVHRGTRAVTLNGARFEVPAEVGFFSIKGSDSALDSPSPLRLRTLISGLTLMEMEIVAEELGAKVFHLETP